MLIIGWIFGIFLAFIQWLHSDTVAFEYRGNTFIDCREKWGPLEGKLFTVSLFLITFLLPLLILAHTSFAIGLKIFFYKPPNNTRFITSEHINKSKVIQLLNISYGIFLPLQKHFTILSLDLNFTKPFLTLLMKNNLIQLSFTDD